MKSVNYTAVTNTDLPIPMYIDDRLGDGLYVDAGAEAHILGEDEERVVAYFPEYEVAMLVHKNWIGDGSNE